MESAFGWVPHHPTPGLAADVAAAESQHPTGRAGHLQMTTRNPGISPKYEAAPNIDNYQRHQQFAKGVISLLLPPNQAWSSLYHLAGSIPNPDDNFAEVEFALVHLVPLWQEHTERVSSPGVPDLCLGAILTAPFTPAQLLKARCVRDSDTCICPKTGQKVK